MNPQNTYIHKSKYVKKKTLQLILNVCWHEGEILNFSDMLHDLCHISNEILFIHNFIFFCSNNTHFVKKRAKIQIPTWLFKG
jgi:hypothetical protein